MKKLIWLMAAFFVALSAAANGKTPIAAAPPLPAPREVAAGIVAWKKSDVGAAPSGYLINDEFLKLAGTTPGDWFPLGLGRLGIADNQEGYLAVINDNVEKRYATAKKLDAAKATEWHRITLAVLAAGGNPRRMGSSAAIDLIADGTYGRVDDEGNGILGKQGINGFIWGLIALDSRGYEVPSGAYYSRDDIILNILSRQLKDGGWALYGEESDPDITAMALQALAPYYNSEKEYAFFDKISSREGGPVVKKARAAADEALAFLSRVQQDDGGYHSWGMPNCESAVQVAVALASLNIDPFADARFIKQGKTVYDGILKFRNGDGGFLHSFVYDAENPSSLPDASNTMAGEQALYGMAALCRFGEGKRRLYHFRDEMDAALKEEIAAVETAIDTLDYACGDDKLLKVYEDYLKIDGLERSYVKNYAKLSQLLAFAGIAYEKEEIVYNSGDAGIIEAIDEFTTVDIAAAAALPLRLTTAQRAEVLRLWNKIRNCFDFDGKERLTIELEKAKNEIDALEREIEAVKNAIKSELYPFKNIGLSKRGAVNDLYRRYLALSEYDRTRLSEAEIEGLLKSKTQVDNLLTALIVAAASAAVCLIVVICIVLHIKKRRRLKKALQMPVSEE